MNKTLISAILVCLLLVVPAMATTVCEECTYVAGQITMIGTGLPVEGASVEVDCNGHTQSTTSDLTGIYTVVFDDADCDALDTAVVTATKGDLSGTNSGVVKDLICINLGIVNVQIPEFGLATGALAVGIVGLGALFMRKRQ